VSGRSGGKPKPKKVARRAGGHVVYVDPPLPTPKRVSLCSVHGPNCPGDHESGGWKVAEGDEGKS
jgi:hypothetical protein